MEQEEYYPLPQIIMSNLAHYACPICDNILKLDDKIYRCYQSHCFDVAKEGYVNLLPVQFKHSKNPGDNKAMVNARRMFLEKGYYQPLASKLVELKNQFSDISQPLLDAGCGEGFYTHQHKNKTRAVYGVDIAKEAIKKAAKKYQSCHFSVATLSQLPFINDYFGSIISIYAPILEEEFTRVLQSNGILITVTPAQKHLYELKALIYDKVQDHDVEKCPIDALSLVHQENLSYPMNIETGQDTLNLLSMTPFAFKASESVKEKLAEVPNFTCQADFQIRVFKKEH
jgi:23S rRNA (guanine745-N1)-methyltransferase